MRQKRKVSQYTKDGDEESSDPNDDIDDELFTDGDFEAVPGSIGESKSQFSCASSADVWVSAQELWGEDEPVLFDGICPNDIHQGDLGDCWLMSAIACLADYPRALKDLITPKELSISGWYEFRLFDVATNTWSTITIDDLIPCSSGAGAPTPIFAKPVGKEIWPLLMEKAFAKFCGSYGALSGGNSGWAFVALTGETKIRQFRNLGDGTWRRCKFSTEKLVERGARNPRNTWWTWNNSDVFDIDQLWSEMRSHSDSSHLMTCSIGKDSDEAEGSTSQGLVTRHIYAILRLIDASLDDGSSERLIKLRNPWGNAREWKGDWSDSSSKWDDNSELKECLALDANPDGTFWMSWADCMDNFTNINLCPKCMEMDTPVEENVEEISGSDDEGEQEGDDDDVHGSAVSWPTFCSMLNQE